MEELEETGLVLRNTVVDLKKYIPNNKSSDEDINKLQSKTVELQDTDTGLNREAIKVETASVPSSKANDNHIVEPEVLLSEKTNKAEYFQEACRKFQGKVQNIVNVSRTKRYHFGEEQLSILINN